MHADVVGLHRCQTMGHQGEAIRHHVLGGFKHHIQVERANAEAGFLIGELLDRFEHRCALLKQLPAGFAGAVLGGKNEKFSLISPGAKHQGEQEKAHAMGADLAADDADPQGPAIGRGPLVGEGFDRIREPGAESLLGVDLTMLENLFGWNATNKSEEIKEVIPDIEMIRCCLQGQLVMVVGHGRLAHVKMGLGHAVVKAIEEG